MFANFLFWLLTNELTKQMLIVDFWQLYWHSSRYNWQKEIISAKVNKSAEQSLTKCFSIFCSLWSSFKCQFHLHHNFFKNHTWRPNKSASVAPWNSRLLKHFYWDTLKLHAFLFGVKVLCLVLQLIIFFCQQLSIIGIIK